MAAPPVPPKGNPDSWRVDNRFSDQNIWSSSNNSLLRKGPQNQSVINGQTPFYQSTSQAQENVPPVPPRPAAGIWQHSRINELLMVPPPPGSGQLYKNSVQFPNFPVRPGENGRLLKSISSPNPASHNFSAVRHRAATSIQFQSNFRSSTNPPRALRFSNSVYDSGSADEAETKHEILQSKSASSNDNFITRPVPLHQNLPVFPSNENFSVFQTTYATINHDAQVVKNKNVPVNIENVLQFMKKRSDSNLIDLYCSLDEGASSDAPSTKCTDDILKLFDPLQRCIESSNVEKVSVETSKSVADENVNAADTGNLFKDAFDRTVRTKLIQMSEEEEISVETIPKQIASEDDQDILDSLNRDLLLKIAPKADTYTKEIDSFCEKLRKMRSDFLCDDYVTNAGLVISPTLDSYQENSLSIKLIIMSNCSERPVSFTCDVNTSIEHITSHAVCTIFDDTSSLCMDNFVLKVRDFSEYLTSHSTLADYEYVHQCHKFDKPVFLTLTDIKDLKRPLSRTKVDDHNDCNFRNKDLVSSIWKEVISFETLSILLDTLQKEVEKIESSALKLDSVGTLQPQGVIQAVKAICTLLSHVETKEITDAVTSIIQICLLFSKSELDANTLPEQLASAWESAKNSENDILHLFRSLEVSLLQLQCAVHELLLMYIDAFNVNFELKCPSIPRQEKMVTDFLDTLLFEVGIVHRLNPNIITQYETYFLVCEVCHGANVLVSLTSKTSSISKSFFPRIVFDEWLQFENISMCTLPREAVLCFTLWGLNMNQAESKQSGSNSVVKVQLGWCGVRLFSYKEELAQGRFLLGLWPIDIDKNSGPLLSNPDQTCPLLHIQLPDFGCTVKFPPVLQNKFASTQMRSFENLEPHMQTLLKEIIERDNFRPLTPDEKELLWEKKQYLHAFPHALPKVLLSAHGWDWACLSDIYSLLKSWSPMSPVDSLVLLMPCFPDIEVRKTAISWMKDIVSDELCDYLPQMIQVLRFEPWHDSPIAWFLLERSLTSIRVAHHLYWLLKQNLSDAIAGTRMQLMLSALLLISGRSMRSRIEMQEELLSNLSDIAEKIKTAKESLRLGILFHELEITHHNLVEDPTCLPLSPSMEVCGIDVKSCSYFTSNTLPLKLVFHTPEMTGKNNEAIFKVGDDLRQDMLTLQMIRIMDKLWLREGLDLKIVTFTCIATEYRKGMVELVPEAETLRKIQSELGLTGSFKDRPIAEWLQKYNTSELEYQQAVENFTLSCAGYCVATYILGVCDRHNDNIMLKTSGHIFHIDFGKFLGDSQMFGNIKRDRTPFVLTSDMAYVINGGDKPSKKFQYFIDLCCQAFNIIRNHKNIFFNLFSLMVSSGVPGVTSSAVNYVLKALLPNISEAEATARFTHMIQDSLKSWFTQFNFFIHNLAQLRFTGDHNEGLMLSFIPKSFSKETDGKIKGLDVIGYRKMYDPEKYYIYVIKVERESLSDAMCIFRTYREFIEFHQKLCMMYPLAKFHSLPGNPLMGRTNIREVADRRKSELGTFLRSLMVMAEEISHCDLVYTFVHPVLRDQEGLERESAKSISTHSRRSSSVTAINGQIKLSIVYKNNSLFIMVMHAKNLSSPKGTAPDPYVKTYLLPDPNKTTKRKTKIVSKNCHPTFMEMLVYNMSADIIRKKNLHVSVWDYDRVQENEFLGSTLIQLDVDLSKEIIKWYMLGHFNN